MQYATLGKSGLKVSRLCLGCMSYANNSGSGPYSWTLDEAASRPFLQRAIELGINFFDTAEGYSGGSSEEILGRALKDFAKRDEVVIATKVFGVPRADGPGSLSRKHILKACDDSLKRLGTDFIDLYQIHRWDYETPIEETLEALNDLVRAGKVLHLGASSMFAWQFSRALAISDANGWSRFLTMQPQYNLVYREEEREMLPLCRDGGIGVLPWSPLARGFLAGNRKRDGGGETARAKTDTLADHMYFQADDFAVAEKLEAVASARGESQMRIALAWLLSRPGVTAPIIGATKLHHLDDAAAALDVTLTDDEIALLEEAYRPHPVLGHGYRNAMGNAANAAQRSI